MIAYKTFMPITSECNICKKITSSVECMKWDYTYPKLMVFSCIECRKDEYMAKVARLQYTNMIFTHNMADKEVVIPRKEYTVGTVQPESRIVEYYDTLFITDLTWIDKNTNELKCKKVPLEEFILSNPDHHIKINISRYTNDSDLNNLISKIKDPFYTLV